VDVGEVRRNLGLSQEEFARRFGFTVASIRNWEGGCSEPYGVARILIAVIAARPDVVDEVLRDPRSRTAPA
jgi:putative transcriptional regulator